MKWKCLFLFMIAIVSVCVSVNASDADSKSLDSLYETAYSNFDNKTGLITAHQLFNIAQKTGNRKMQGKAMVIIAKYFNSTSKSSAEFIPRAKKIMNWLGRNGFTKDRMHVHVYVIMSMIDSREYVTAYVEILKMKQLSENNHSAYGLQSSYRMLGYLFESRLAYSEALKYYKLELAYAKKTKLPTIYACFYDVANCEFALKDYKRALIYSQLGRRLVKLPSVLVAFDIQEGLIHGFMGDYVSLKKDYDHVMDYVQHNILDKKLIEHFNTLQVVYLWGLGNFDKAAEMISKMDINNQMTLYPEHYKRQGDYLKAYEEQGKLLLYSDSLSSSFNTAELNEFGVKAIQHKLSEERQKFTMESQQSRYRMQFVIVGAVMIILALLIIMTLNILRNQKRKAAIIEAQCSARDKFIQDMSHEVRTPLNIINGFTSMMGDPTVDLSEEDRNQMVGEIKNYSVQLTEILTNMLTLYKLESGLEKLEIEKFDAMMLCGTNVDSSKLRCHAGVTMMVDAKSPQGVTFKTDGRYFDSILQVLLDNASKFTDNGSIVLGYNLTENPGYITFFVEDCGPGIPPDKSQVIFDRFAKLDNYKPGIGIGLTIAQMTAEKLHAHLKVDISYHKGARMVLVHPL